MDSRLQAEEGIKNEHNAALKLAEANCVKVQNKRTEVEEKLKLVESRTVHQDKAQDESSS